LSWIPIPSLAIQPLPRDEQTETQGVQNVPRDFLAIPYNMFHVRPGSLAQLWLPRRATAEVEREALDFPHPDQKGNVSSAILLQIVRQPTKPVSSLDTGASVWRTTQAVQRAHLHSDLRMRFPFETSGSVGGV
jgi:hypothetical protein